jgi:hypothetical protein
VVVALLAVGQGRPASLVAAWDSGGRWAVSAPLRTGGARVASASPGPSGAVTVLLAGRRAVTVSAASRWRALPPVPAGAATLAPGPRGGFDALVVHRARLAVWRLAAGPPRWALAQVISVPIQWGSSG